VLATVGIYGAVAYTVGQRTGEIGVRMAFGAETRDIPRLVVDLGRLHRSRATGESPQSGGRPSRGVMRSDRSRTNTG
jgi:hypothetical protein